MKNRLLGIVLVLLVLANIATLGVFWYYKIHNKAAGPSGIRQREQGGGASAFIIKQIGFNAAQQASYKDLVQQHQQAVRNLRDQLHTAKDNFFDLLGDSMASASKVDEASSVIGKLEKQLDVQTFYHFRQVRAICTPEQKIKLDNCIKQVMRMMAPPPVGERPQGPPPGAGGQGPEGMTPPPPGEGPPQGDRLPPPPQQ